ncbi:MAG: biotin--[acetyl-CoA-carboxylase] ligase [Bacteroidia bacterium]
MSRLFLGAQHIHVGETTSTNTLAQQLLTDRPPEGTVISADVQTQGRGQAGTTWTASSGQNILMSVILYPKLAAPEAYALGQMAALAVWQCIHALDQDADLHIKWPNDILLEGHKIAGILIENQLQGSRVHATVIGIGLNVNQAVFPPQHRMPTSLFLHSGQTYELHDIQDRLLNSLEANYLRMRQHGAASFKRDFEARMYGFQQTIPFIYDGETHHCKVLGTDKQGRLLLETPDGSERSFGLKEIALEASIPPRQ